MDSKPSPATLSERQRPPAVIAVDMRQQDLFDFLHPHRLGLVQYTVHVRIGTEGYVDDQSAFLADDVLIGPLKGHDAGIIGRKLSHMSGRCHQIPLSCASRWFRVSRFEFRVSLGS